VSSKRSEDKSCA